jgi:hypothetical protein
MPTPVGQPDVGRARPPTGLVTTSRTVHSFTRRSSTGGRRAIEPPGKTTKVIGVIMVAMVRGEASLPGPLHTREPETQ